MAGRLSLVVALVAALVTTDSFACGLNGAQQEGSAAGFAFYRNVVIGSVGRTGRQLGSYQGVHTGNMERCVTACVQDRECSAVLFRVQMGYNDCLKYSRTDYETGEKGRDFIGRGFKQPQWAFVIRDKAGRLCK